MRLGLLAAGLALFLSATALPAAAETRDEAREQANGFIDYCFGTLEGEPVAGADEEGFTVVCWLGETAVTCDWSSRNNFEGQCIDDGGPMVMEDQPDLVWVVNDLHDLVEAQPVDDDRPDLAPADPNPQLSAIGSQEQDQDRDHDNKGKKGKKGKQGKKGGKGRR
jgi:hypothetical protein